MVAMLPAILATTALVLSPTLRSSSVAAPRARVAAAAVDPEVHRLLADAEAYIEEHAIGEEEASGVDSPQARRRARQKAKEKAVKAVKAAKKMSKRTKSRIGCYGCGADLQTVAVGAAGYVESDRYELKEQHKQLRLLLCTRCRALSHGDILPAVIEGRLKTAVQTPVAPPPLPLEGVEEEAGAAESAGMGIGVTTPEQLRAELAPLRGQKVLIVMLVEVPDVTGSFLPKVRDLVGGNPIILVGTKLDMLPKGTDPNAILGWMANRLSPRLNLVDTHLVSARTGEGVAGAARAIMKERAGRDTFILGAANVGKSLFIGSFLEHALGGRAKRLPISSATPGTTLRLIGVDCFGGGSRLFDTPGLHVPHRLSAQLLPEELRKILPRGRIKPYTPPLDGPLEGKSFFWGGLVRVDVLEAPLAARLSFVSAYTLSVSSCTGGAEAAQAHYDENVGKTLTPPLTPASAADLGGLQMAQRIELELFEMEQAADVAISGLGWVSVGALASLRPAGRKASQRMVMEVWVPRGVQVSLRPPMPIAGLPNEVAGFEEPM